jgi:predicted nucleic acid-binding Zn ribbon protein
VERDDTPTPTCALCGDPFWLEQAGQKYCSSRHRETASKRRQRSRRDRGELLVPWGTALTEVYAKASPPRPAIADDGYPDHDEDQGDDGPGAWSSAWRLHEAEQAIRARYERLMQPYLVQLRRNPGVRPPGLVALERQRDDEIAEMIRAHDHAAQVGRAQRNEAKRINEAHDRQRERDALRALAQDLPGGSRRYEVPRRATHDIWRW